VAIPGCAGPTPRMAGDRRALDRRGHCPAGHHLRRRAVSPEPRDCLLEHRERRAHRDRLRHRIDRGGSALGAARCLGPLGGHAANRGTRHRKVGAVRLASQCRSSHRVRRPRRAPGSRSTVALERSGLRGWGGYPGRPAADYRLRLGVVHPRSTHAAVPTTRVGVAPRARWSRRLGRIDHRPGCTRLPARAGPHVPRHPVWRARKRAGDGTLREGGNERSGRQLPGSGCGDPLGDPLHRAGPGTNRPPR